MTHHRSTRPRRTTWALAVGLALPALLAAGCSRTESGANSGDLFIESCSLACTDGQGGAQVFCGIVNVFENSEIAVRFSQPLDPSTVGPATFRVTDVTNGTSPDGRYLVDPLDPRVAIFRPAIVFSNGGVGFAFRSNTSYEVRIPGQAQGDNAPFIRSIAGKPNQSRMQCTVFTSEGVTDPVPGNPEVQVFITVVTGYNAQGNPATFEQRQVQPQGTPILNVWRSSPIIIQFNELMNVATISSVVAGTNPPRFEPSFMSVQLDLDGNLATSDPGDRINLSGNWPFVIDEDNLITTVTYTPDSEFPSSGSDPNNPMAPDPRLLVIRIPPNVVDLTNKPVTTATGGGTLAAVAEYIEFSSIGIPDMDGEGFESPGGAGGSLDDVSHGGSNWGQIAGGDPLLAPGISGGSGRLGELVIGTNETVVLNTDSQIFPIGFGGQVSEQVDVIGNDTGGGYPFSITVTDGVFEFSTLSILPGGRLLLEGSNPARLVIRGPIDLGPGSIVDISGDGGGEHDSIEGAPVVNNAEVIGGPGGGSGGFGADRADFTGTALATAGGSLIVAGLTAPAAGGVRQGRTGEGVGAGSIGGGGGGPAWPTTYPTMLTLNAAGADGNVGFNSAISPEPLGPGAVDPDCVSLQLGAPGGGGGYSRPGAVGSVLPSPDEPVAESVIAGGSTTLFPPAFGAPGDPTGLGLTMPPNVNNTGYTVRLLEWENGNLRGGAGGGGGGNHPYGARTSGDALTPPNCFVNFLFAADWTHWHDHSGAPGGGGGGAVEFLSGKRIDLEGLINARGGQGASSVSGAATDDFGQYAIPGGGGSAGAVKLKAPVVQFLPGGTRIDVRGGNGGTAFYAAITPNAAEARGGAGGTGLVRIEDGVTTPGSGVSFAGLRALVAPFDVAFPDDSLDFLSVAEGVFTSAPTLRPDSITASSSCWIQPTGNFVGLGFRADVGTALAEQGWTMNVVVNSGGTITKRPFRGTTTQFPVDWEDQFGNLLGYDLGPGEMAAPIVVRFQGARTSSSLGAPCDTDPNDFFGDIEPGTLTRWVAHPNELNGILSQTGTPLTPNLVRFVIIFDQTNDPLNGDTPGAVLTGQGVLGVDDVLILADPS